MPDSGSPTLRQRTALVVGGGPVGALTALSLQKRGWKVELWEARDDPRGRTIAMTNLRSINLNISARGLGALASVDPALGELLLSESIKMPSRLIHFDDGRTEAQLYDPLRGQCSNSISRSVLNQRLVEALPEAIDISFNTKLDRIDFKRRVAYGVTTAKGAAIGEETTEIQAHDEPEQVETSFDLVVGADGSWSKVRAQLMRAERTNYSQEFLPHAYIELHMPPNPAKPDGFAMPPNHLHIWPRHSFMLIALPNKDGSFTLTLFIPFSELEKVKSRQQATAFFKENFPDALELVGDRLIDDFLNNPRGNLVEVKVSPSTWSSHAVLVGDACHSMVPFYGQGLNCGLEDVRVLGTYLDKHGITGSTNSLPGSTERNLAEALAAYGKDRQRDLDAIQELAQNNYIEMRHSVVSRLYHVRRAVDWVLTRLIPSTPIALSSAPKVAFPTARVNGWTSLYDLVTFRPDVSYSEALRRERWQRAVVANSAYASIVGLAAGAAVLSFKAAQPWLQRR